MWGKFRLNRVICLITALVSSATAQQVYRCGSSYSHIPCEGANSLPLQPQDAKAQEEARKANDAATRRDRRLAEELERNRLKEEAFLTRARGPIVPPPYDPSLGRREYEEARSEARKKSPHFTARTPAQPKADKDKPGNSTPGKP